MSNSTVAANPCRVGSLGSASCLSPHSSQSSPKSSCGCGERSFAQAIESMEQYLSHPQQIRSGFAGCMGNFFVISGLDSAAAAASQTGAQHRQWPRQLLVVDASRASSSCKFNKRIILSDNIHPECIIDLSTLLPMRLTQWTDYTLRVLMYCAASLDRAQPVTITEIAESYGISRSHLTKIVQELAARGWLETMRGRGGGMRLSMPAKDICLGAVVRATETDFAMVECFDPALNQCRLSQHCKLKSVLNQATLSYLAVLDGVTLADLVAPAVTGTSSLNSQRLQLIPGLPYQEIRKKNKRVDMK